MGKKSTRRSFLKQAAGGVVLFNVFPRNLLAGGGTPPSETVCVASIGAAGRAAADINGTAGAGARIVGLCDVDTRRVGGMRKRYEKAPFFKDYREMLDKLDKEIDAVIVGTPDHWHAAQAIECLRRGKHVQCEKPLGQSFADVEKMIAAAKKTKLVHQAMNQGHAYHTIRDFREWVEAGLIGEVTEAHIWCPAKYSFMDSLHELKQEWKIPKELDWERWQGPVPHRPYYHRYLPGAWRFWTMYGTSTLGDWSCHLMDPLFWTFGLGLPRAVTAEVIGCDWKPEVHGLTFPKGARTTMEFVKRDGRPFKLVWYDGLGCEKVPMPKGFADPKEFFAPTMTHEVAKKRRDGMANGAFVIGTKGVIEYGHHGANYLRILPNLNYTALKNQGTLPAEKYKRVPNGCPYVEFLNAIKGGDPVGSDFSYAGTISEASLLGVAALFDPGKRLVWDAASKKFANSDAANALLNPPRLPGW